MHCKIGSQLERRAMVWEGGNLTCVNCWLLTSGLVVLYITRAVKIYWQLIRSLEKRKFISAEG